MFSSNTSGETEVARGESLYAVPGTFTWVCPAGVTSVSVVCIGGGGAGGMGYYGSSDQLTAGGGGGLGYKNNYSVTPGSSYTVVVGAGSRTAGSGQKGGDSYFVGTTTVRGIGGDSCNNKTGGTGGGYVGDGGGSGGNGGGNGTTNFGSGGGGAGGYSGNGGAGGNYASGTAGSGGGGGGGGYGSGNAGAGGGGVGPFGSGSNGSGGTNGSSGGGGGGSGGETGQYDNQSYLVGVGGSYGGGGGGYPYGGANKYIYRSQPGADGCVRIIWPGSTRTFPSTDVDTP